jgi:glycosyltransferase involved in cell wall biosynthesis
MNILHTEASPGWGGQEIRILREAEGMRARGHTLLFCVARGARLGKEAREAGFIVYECLFHKRFWLVTLFRLLLILRRHRIGLVNTHSSLDSWIGGCAARLLRIPIVRTRHLSTPIRGGWNSRLLYGVFTDFVVTTCAAIQPMIAEQSRKKNDLIRSIPTGVDPTKMQVSQQEVEAFRASLGVTRDHFLVGTACFMRSWKGIFDFLQAANLLRDETEIRWVLIGGGHEAVYRRRAAELRLEGIVQFTGHLTYPIPALQALDVFALLSTAHEGVSQAILQAAYLCKPLIATSVGGLQEICIDGQTGVRVDAHAPEQVAEAVRTLKANVKLRTQMGMTARQLVLRQFTLTHMLDQMEEVYRLCGLSR